jgi:hypothetical protein
VSNIRTDAELRTFDGTALKSINLSPTLLTLIRMAKDEKDLDFFKGLML